jgi:hypothetical protein
MTTLEESNPEHALEFRRVFRKLTEHQVALAGVSVALVVFLGLIAAKVLMARYFIIIILALMIEICVVSIVLFNYEYLIRGRKLSLGSFKSGRNNVLNDTVSVVAQEA